MKSSNPIKEHELESEQSQTALKQSIPFDRTTLCIYNPIPIISLLHVNGSTQKLKGARSHPQEGCKYFVVSKGIADIFLWRPLLAMNFTTI